MPKIVHSKHAAGLIATPRPQTAGAVHVAKFRYSFAVALAAGDILELGVLPSYADIVDYKLVPEGNFNMVTASVGIMTGELGSDDATRDAGTELFAAATTLDAVRLPAQAAAFNIAATPQARGIGLKFSAAVAADAAKKLTLIVQYRQ